MESMVIGDTSLEIVAIIVGAFTLYVLLSAGRPAQRIADEMFEMYTSNSPDREQADKLAGEMSLQRSLGRIWMLVGLALSWVAVVQLGANILVGWAICMFFTGVSITAPKTQGHYYAQKFSDPALMKDRQRRMVSWSMAHWVFTLGLAVGVYWFATGNGIFLGAR